MTNYRCRIVRPEVTEWMAVRAETETHAAQDFFYDNDIFSLRVRPEGGEQVRLALVEVEGHGEFICRVFYSGIFRSGETHTFEHRLNECAHALGWTRDPKELIAPGWELEEKYPTT